MLSVVSLQTRTGEVSPVIVGRDRELSMLVDARRDAPGAVFVGGEAGVGKSRLIREFISRETDAQSLVGGCVELSAEGLPFAPFSAVLRRLIRERGLDGVMELMPGGPGAAPTSLARLLPEFGEPDLDASMPEARARLFDQVLVLFERLAEERPTVLIIEDAHWADRSTRDLLTYLIRSLPQGLLVVLTYRTDELHRTHPLRPMLAELARLDWVRRLDLPRLSLRAVAELIKSIVGHVPDPRLLEKVYERSEGNPLFVEALLNCEGKLNSELPESLRDLILGSMRRLPDETQDVLRVASAGGGLIEHTLLSVVTGLDDTELSRMLRPAVSANVLIVEGDAYAFRHALVREAIHDDLLPGEHTRTHTRFAEALESDPTLVPTGRAAAELAYHWYAAHDATWALVSAWAAAKVANRSAAYTERLRMLARVLELWEKVPDAADRLGVDHIGVLEKAIAACDLAGESERGMAFAKAALKEIDADQDPLRAAGVLEQRGRLKTRLGNTDPLADLREAARLVATDRPSVMRARVLSGLAQQLYLVTSGNEEASGIAQEALTMAREVGDPLTEAHALVTLSATRFVESDPERHLADLEEAREVAMRAGGPSSVLFRIATNVSHVLEAIGEHERAAKAAREGIDAAHDSGLSRTSGTFLTMNLTEPLVSLGRWDEAIEIIEHALELTPAPRTRAGLQLLRGVIAVRRGDLDTAEDTFARASEVFIDTGRLRRQELFPLCTLEIELRMAQNDPGGALVPVGRTLSAGDLQESTRYSWPFVATAIQAAVQAEDQSLLTDLSVLIDKLPVVGRQQRAWQLTARARVGRADWDAAAAAWESVDQPYRLADSLIHAAGAVAGSDRDGSIARLNQATPLLQRLRAAPLLADVELLSRRYRMTLTGRRDTGPEQRVGLTPRELEVLNLVTEGFSNRQIATELFISAKTASVHVSNILAKLGVASRGEAAATAHRLGLFDPAQGPPRAPTVSPT
jgi:DNA-binding CsgD family transcriptional regulator/tetratricopeptide (TPR) repeat protein